MNIIPIHSLSQYIENLSLFTADTFYRGENALFDSHDAGMFRVMDIENGERCYNSPVMLKQFWNETSYKLSDKEKTCFIAFAQYHGLPTNLLDITTSPLVAFNIMLIFASVVYQIAPIVCRLLWYYVFYR